MKEGQNKLEWKGEYRKIDKTSRAYTEKLIDNYISTRP